MIDNIKDQLKRDEGFRAKPYYCSEGKLTIGIGRCLDTNPLTQAEANYLTGQKGITPATATEIIHAKGISEEQALWLLEAEVEHIIGALLNHYGWMRELDDARFGVCVNMSYQLGMRGFRKFKHFLKALEGGLFAAAGAEMLNSRWARQTEARANRLYKQMMTGRWV